MTHSAETVCATESKAGLSAENRNQKSIVSGPKPSASLMPACQGPQATVPDADSAASFLGYLYIVSQYTVRLMTPCVWRILCLRNSRSVPYFRNHRIYQLQHAETKSAPNVLRLLSAETECPPKVPICLHSAPKPKTNFRRPLVVLISSPAVLLTAVVKQSFRSAHLLVFSSIFSCSSKP